MLDLLIYNPLTNALLLIYEVLFKNYALAIIVLTLLIRLITLPLTLKQQISSVKMAALQPQMKKLQEELKNDPQKLQAEMRKLGFSPLAGCLPTLIQFPVLIGLYTAIQRSLAFSPLSLLELGKHIYPFLPNLSKLVPINSVLLGVLDLGSANHVSSFYVIPALVVISTWLSNKVMMAPTSDPQMQQTNQMMSMMMPIMIGFFSLQTPIGLGIYWIVSNLIGLAQYALTKPQMDRAKAQYAVVGGAPASGSSSKSSSVSDKPLFAPPKSKVKAKPAITGNAKAAPTNSAKSNNKKDN